MAVPVIRQGIGAVFQQCQHRTHVAGAGMGDEGGLAVMVGPVFQAREEAGVAQKLRRHGQQEEDCEPLQALETHVSHVKPLVHERVDVPRCSGRAAACAGLCPRAPSPR